MAFGGFRGNRQSVIWKWQFTRKCLRKLPFNARVLGVNKKRTGDTVRDTGTMLVSADFNTIPEQYAKNAPDDARVDGVPCVSFPFYIDHLNPAAKYLHWEFSDPDSIPVCGFEWIHWTMANLPVAALMFDPSDAHALQIPPDFSRRVTAMIPEAVQGRNSQASPAVRAGSAESAARRTLHRPAATGQGPRLCTADLGHHLADRRTRTGLLAQRDAARPRAFAGRRRRRHHADRQVLSSASQSVFRKHPCVMPQ